MRLRPQIFVALIVLFSLLEACAVLPHGRFKASQYRPPECEQFLAQLDATVSTAGVRESSIFRVRGFPYLRANRFSAALRDRLDSEAQIEMWVDLMRTSDLEARAREIQNLPADALEALCLESGAGQPREMLMARAAFCSDSLFRSDKGHEGYYEAVRSAVQTPDEYSTLLRVVGLYPIASIPVVVLTHKARTKAARWHEVSFDALGLDGRLTAYVPSQTMIFPERSIASILDGCSQNPLRIPLLSPGQERDLAASFAPVFFQDVVADYDRPGRVTWQGDRPAVDAAKPTVYYFVSHAFLDGRPVVQMNFVVWYAAREGPNAPWIERGALDGLTVRISLDPEGRPFMADCVNNCGCYHFFVPRKEVLRCTIAKPFQLDAFVPQWLPPEFPAERLQIRVDSGWHQVQQVTAARSVVNTIEYDLIPYSELEMLSKGEGATESIFNDQGVAKGSWRIEPFMLFPMGVPDVGSMRQRGHQAIRLVGRSYFDDPELFDRNFIFRYDDGDGVGRREAQP
jgi:hypothetical protein